MKGCVGLGNTECESEEGEREGEDGVGEFHQFEVMAKGFKHEGSLRGGKDTNGMEVFYHRGMEGLSQRGGGVLSQRDGGFFTEEERFFSQRE
jgi:hypothetical protein